MALGTGLGVSLGNPLEPKTSATSGAAAVPFMMTSDKSVNFSSDTIVNESIKKVKDTNIMRVLMRAHQLMTPYSPIFITQERHYAYTLGKDVPFTPLEREWMMSRLQQQHPSWMSEEIEEAIERLGAQKLATCPCPEHMRRKSVAVINIPFIMSKVEVESEEEGDKEDKEKEMKIHKRR